MTNRSKSARKSKPLRCLDLSFEGEHDTPLVRSNSTDNVSFVRDGTMSARRHPLSPYSYEKGQDFQRQLQEDMEKLFEDELIETHSTPGWAIDTSREITHSGESALYSQRLLSPCKLDQQLGGMRFQKGLLQPSRYTPSPSRDGKMYYRPNRTHQYLTATELKNQTQRDTNIKHGRPTRTTLLRARQKSNMTPVNAYEVRREMMKRHVHIIKKGTADRPENPARTGLEEIRNSCPFTNPKDLLQMFATDGESLHSFLTGARYNRAHYLDAKSLTVYGVYMPRNNPAGCFVTTNKLKDLDEDHLPCAPPDSPRSEVPDDVSSPFTMPRLPLSFVPSVITTPSTPQAKPRQVWGDMPTVPQEEEKKDDDTETSRSLPQKVTQEIIFWPEGLGNKPHQGNKFSFSFPSPKQAKASTSHTVNECILPWVQGVSVKKNKKIRHESTEEASVPSAQPPPTPIVASSVNLISDRPKVETISVEKLISDTITVRKVPSVKEQSSGKENSVEDESTRGKVINEQEAAPPVSNEVTTPVENRMGAMMPPEAIKEETKPKKILVDRSVNVPSIPGDTSHLDEFTLTPRPRAIRQKMFELDDKVKTESVNDNTPEKEESEIEIGSATDGLSMEAKGDSSLFMSDKMRELTGIETPLEENMEEGSIKDSASNNSENDKKRIFITEDQTVSDVVNSKGQNELSEKSDTNGCNVIDERMSTDSDAGSTVHETDMTEARAEYNITVDVQIATNEAIPTEIDDDCHVDNISLGSVNNQSSL